MGDGYRSDIDGLRGVAIIAVLFFHAHILGFGGGYLGVDVFFVISGFLITRLIATAPSFDLLDFYKRRARRLLPALFVVLAATTVGALVLMLPPEAESFSESVIASALFAANLFFWSETGYFARASEELPLLHLWSLGVEEQFYLVFPLAMILLARFRQRPLVWIIALAAASFTGACFADESDAFFLPHLRAWELLCGSIIALSPPLRSGPLSRDGVSLLGFLLIVSSIIWPGERSFSALVAAWPVAGAALVIFAATAGQTVVSRVLSSRGLVFVGLISYPLYLWHWPVMVAMRQIEQAPGVVATTAALAISVLLAVLTWRYIERPVRFGDVLPSRLILPVTAVASGLAVVVGAAINLSGGWPSRWSPAAVELAVDVSDVNPERRVCSNRKASQMIAGDVCYIGADKGPVTFAVMGDSHASSIWPAIDDAAAEAGRRGAILTRDGCRPILGVGPIKNGALRMGCSEFNEHAVRFLKDRPGIRTVFLSARWGAQATGYGLNSGQIYYADKETETPSVEENARTFERGLARMMEALQGREIVFVAATPEHPFDVPSTTALAAEDGDLMPVTPVAAFFERQKAVFSVVESLRDRITLLKPHEVFCPHGKCLAALGRHALYSDDSHISLEGAKLLVPMFRQFFIDSERNTLRISNAPGGGGISRP